MDIIDLFHDILKKTKKLGTYHYYSYICNVQWYKYRN